MAIARMKLDGKWVNLYANEINSRLKKTENLSDLTDTAVARENLEIVGDVTTHNHDSQYLPLIQQLVVGNDNNVTSIDVEKQERITADNKLETEIQDLSASLTETIETIREENIDVLESNLSSVKSRLDSVSLTGSNAATNSFVISSTTESVTPAAGYDFASKTTTKSYDTKNGITTDIYELKAIIQKLATLAHSHKVTTTSEVKNSNCNCDCDCCGH